MPLKSIKHSINLPLAWCDTSTAGLNSEFSFSLNGCLTNVVCCTILSVVRGWTDGFNSFSWLFTRIERINSIKALNLAQRFHYPRWWLLHKARTHWHNSVIRPKLLLAMYLDYWLKSIEYWYWLINNFSGSADVIPLL